MIDFYKKHEEIINYLIVGVLTTIVSLTTYYICVYTFLNPNKELELLVANIISWIAAVTFAYVTNRIFVFKSKNNKSQEIIKFYLSRIFSLLLDSGLMYLFVNVLNYNDKIIKIVVQLIIVIVNYLLSKLIIFKKSN
jgi:putative flippase GtrA